MSMKTDPARSERGQGCARELRKLPLPTPHASRGKGDRGGAKFVMTNDLACRYVFAA
jgi:hypothetical protein